ncbi:hypothetical protein AOXY_G33948 [Acipenser oxyrinchus oxyrinchus]|uniref:Uncharacterized protein n=1 Tax=Acipenser oxyrinchus oxyrinchus TaxID=40147 RepID=A0AAD8CGU6_ACIOX|nr:hypothetical protein AOXY_G33948 [Acipenser oxyrinchus oxyrinchus]
MDGAGFSRTGPGGTTQSPGSSAQNQGQTGPRKRTHRDLGMSEISERGRDTATQTQRVDTSSLKRGPETHAESSSAKRVQQDNKSLKKTRPLPILKSPDFAAVEQELSQMKQDLDTVKGELTTVTRELKSANDKLFAINQP